MKKPACQIRGLEKAFGPNKVLKKNRHYAETLKNIFRFIIKNLFLRQIDRLFLNFDPVVQGGAYGQSHL